MLVHGDLVPNVDRTVDGEPVVFDWEYGTSSHPTLDVRIAHDGLVVFSIPGVAQLLAAYEG